MDDSVWNEGLAKLLMYFDAQGMTEARAEGRARIYHERLASLTNGQWLDAVNAAIDHEPNQFFPSVATLLKYARPDGSLVRAANTTKAQEVYEEIVDAYERGEVITGRTAKQEWGQAALEALAAAGGVQGFQWCEKKNEPWRRKAFIETFVSVADADPKALIPLPEPSITDVFKLEPGEAKPLAEVVSPGLGFKTLTSGASSLTNPTATVATPPTTATVVAPPVMPEGAKAMLKYLKEREANAKPITVTDERLAELKRQAEEITKAEPQGESESPQ